MHKHLNASLAAAALLLFSGAAAQEAAAPPPDWSTPSEAPDLGSIGEWPVATRVIEVRVPDRPGLGVVHDASLSVRLFFPAIDCDCERATYRHAIQLPLAGALEVAEGGYALVGAKAVQHRRFPLVVLSHGYGGWSEHMSRLAEVLASHGYVVASIDHVDAGYTNAPEFFASFGEVVLRRSHDQRAVLTALLDGEAGGDAPIDPNVKAGIIGYSMGGYGALGTAGATYDFSASPVASLPEEVRTTWSADTQEAAANVGAIVAIAPWGGQPESRMWTGEALRQVTLPLLLVGGGEDSVVDYNAGLRWLFDGADSSDRYLLTLREAQHNIAGNAVTMPSDADPRFLSYFSEPVWRGERLNQVVGHFVVAFLDARLKQSATAQAYLDVPVEDANEGSWPLAFGDQGDGMTAGDEEPGYWRGFHRGHAIGMTLEHRGVGQ